MHFTAGHLLFEMAAGYELTTTAPTDGDFAEVSAKKDSFDITMVTITSPCKCYIKLILSQELRKIFAQTEIDNFLSIKQV